MGIDAGSALFLFMLGMFVGVFVFIVGIFFAKDQIYSKETK